MANAIQVTRSKHAGHDKPVKVKPVRTPTRLQMEAVECGAACLAMILEHFGKYMRLEEVRVACGVSRDGSKAQHILVAARKLGLKAQGYSRSLESLKRRSMPVIIFWNFNHFVVLEGFARGRAFLNDPAFGRRSLSESEFEESFTGVTLEFEPTAEFCRNRTRPSLLPALIRRVAGSWKTVGFIVAATLLITLLSLVTPSFLRIFLDRVLGTGSTIWAAPLVIVVLIVAGALFVLTMLQQHMLLRLDSKVAVASAAQFVWHVLRLPISFFQQRMTADISARVEINDRIASLLASDISMLLIRLGLVVVYMAVMLRFDPLLAVVGAAFALLNLAVMRRLASARADTSQRLITEHSKLTAAAVNGLGTIEALKASGAEAEFFARWAGHHARASNAEGEMARQAEVASVMPQTIISVSMMVMLVLSAWRVIDGVLSVGQMIAFQALYIAFLTPLNGLALFGDRLQLLSGDMTRIDDVLRYPLDREHATKPADAAEDSAKLRGQVTLRNVTFGYSQLEKPLLRDFSLTIRPGARVALVGGSGSGKSTVAKLVAGLYEPWSGEICFDDTPRNSIDRSVIKKSVAMVDQVSYFAAGLIRDNLTLWNDAIEFSDVVQAAKDAAIHADIVKREKAYDGHVAEAGANFSGGQRQRLEIARALCIDPSILILDEATSALDPVTEASIDECIRRRGCTCLIVAHRLSTIRDCDEIIVLQGGTVVERGRHETLIARDGVYARLIRMDDGAPAGRATEIDNIVTRAFAAPQPGAASPTTEANRATSD